ncbi:MAG: outer membrane beta-barrel protein [Lewinellaceae bacterium]|nr:outer membrane beta-barrel protein [Lewinellaceae bacterium]
MRKIFPLLILFFILATGAEAQIWLELGVKGTMGMTGFYNKNIANDSNHDSQFGLGLSVGGVAAFNFAENHGLNIEVLSATHHQSMSFRGDDGLNNAVNVEWKGVDTYFMYRWYRNNGAFLEIGPKLTYVNEVQQSFGTDWSKVNDKYASRYTSAAFGVGGFVSTSNVLTIKTGIRAEYALTDMVSEQGKMEGYPSPYTAFDNYAETRPFRAGFYLEVTFGVGGLAKSMCGARGMIWGTGYN